MSSEIPIAQYCAIGWDLPWSYGRVLIMGWFDDLESAAKYIAAVKERLGYGSFAVYRLVETAADVRLDSPPIGPLSQLP